MKHPNLTNLSAGSKCVLDEQAWIGFAESGRGSISLGSKVRIRPFVMLRTCGGHIKIGNRSVVGVFCVFHALGGITLGSDVLISPHVGVYAQNHGIRAGKLISGQSQDACPIAIEDGAWIGSHSVILGPVTIGAGAVVCAGSVVTHDVPSNAIVGGVPARFIKMRD